jgi:hypothetical protein
MEPRFIRKEARDLRRSQGDSCDENAWVDLHPKWDQADLRWFPLGVDPNEDPRYFLD